MMIKLKARQRKVSFWLCFVLKVRFSSLIQPRLFWQKLSRKNTTRPPSLRFLGPTWSAASFVRLGLSFAPCSK